MDFPPDNMVDGRLVIHLPYEPVSVQASGGHKRAFMRKVAERLPKVDAVLTGPVGVSIIWRTGGVYRYLSHKSLDLDNIIKPILDSLVGSVLVDDTQVHSLSVDWAEWTRNDHQIEVTLSFDPGTCLPRTGLVFVDLGKGLCSPVSDVLMESGEFADPKTGALAKLLILGSERVRINVFEAIKWLGDENAALNILRSPRLFHRSKVKERWNVVPLKDFEEQQMKRLSLSTERDMANH